MPGSFFDSWNPVLPDMEAIFSEDWTINGATWPAIEIETSDYDERLIKGGVMTDARVRIIVREAVYQGSGVKVGSYVTARGTDFTVQSIESDGDASRLIICGPRGTDVWR